MSVELPLSPEDVNEIATILDGSSYDRLDIRTSRFRLRVEWSGEGWSQEWSLDEGAEAAVAAAQGSLNPGHQRCSGQGDVLVCAV